MSASDRGTMTVYRRAKFENELGPQVVFEPTTRRLTARESSYRKQRSTHQDHGSRSKEKFYAESVVTPGFMTCGRQAIQISPKLPQTNGICERFHRTVQKSSTACVLQETVPLIGRASVRSQSLDAPLQ